LGIQSLLKVKRVYDDAKESDGLRILVDRLWPRGLSKEKAKVDLWLKEVAPSNELRKWFGHEPAKWAVFKRRYFKELNDKTEQVESIREKAKEGTVTLVYAAKHTEYNNAVALKEYLEGIAG
jgi:uncharacterized protein YeaO (DUF488 family)